MYGSYRPGRATCVYPKFLSDMKFMAPSHPNPTPPRPLCIPFLVPFNQSFLDLKHTHTHSVRIQVCLLIELFCSETQCGGERRGAGVIGDRFPWTDAMGHKISGRQRYMVINVSGRGVVGWLLAGQLSREVRSWREGGRRS